MYKDYGKARVGGDQELTDREIRELAECYPPGPGATALLRQVGFPILMAPSAIGVNSLDYWQLVATEVSRGVMEDGRAALIAAAHQKYPRNPVFAAVLGPRRVLVVGTVPYGEQQLRADREFRGIETAATTAGLVAYYAPAAEVTDLDRILRHRPDVLHLVCHGRGGDLVFEDAYGERNPVPASQVARLLDAYREYAGVRLHGLVLAACESGDMAPLFTSAAEVVLAHRGPLDDGAAAVFARHLYAMVPHSADLAHAARLAAEHTATEIPDGIGANLRDNLVALGPLR